MQAKQQGNREESMLEGQQEFSPESVQKPLKASGRKVWKEVPMSWAGSMQNVARNKEGRYLRKETINETKNIKILAREESMQGKRVCKRWKGCRQRSMKKNMQKISKVLGKSA